MKCVAAAGSGVAALLGLGLTASGLASEPPLCRTSLTLEPEIAWIDQQVLLSLRIESRHDVQNVEWLLAPTLPGLRSERLPGKPDAGASQHAGVAYRVREEARALFPERAGLLELPAARLRCTGPHAVEDVEVPGARLRVRELPTSGRPSDFSGLVGALRIQRRLYSGQAAENDRFSVGDSLRLSVSLSGTGNLWDAPAPMLVATQPGSAEWFALEPQQDFERGDELSVRRLFRYDVVPREPGELRLPEQRLNYFDPHSERYAVAIAPEIRVTVVPRVAETSATTTPQPAARPRQSPGQEPSRAPWSALAALLAVACLGLLAWRLRRSAARRAAESGARRGRALGARESSRDSDAGSAALETADASARRLRSALAQHLPGAARETPEAILAQRELAPAVRELAGLLAAVERVRFDPEARAPEPQEIERALEAVGPTRRPKLAGRGRGRR